MKNSYNLFYLKKLFRTSIGDISLKQKNSPKNMENFGQKILSFEYLQNKLKNRKKKNVLNVQFPFSFRLNLFFWPKDKKKHTCFFKKKKEENKKCPKTPKKNSSKNFYSLSFRSFFFQRTMFSIEKRKYPLTAKTCLYRQFLKGCKQKAKNRPLVFFFNASDQKKKQKNQKIQSILFKKSRKKDFLFSFVFFGPLSTFCSENKKEKNFLLKKISFIFQKILHSQVANFFEISPLHFLKNMKASFERLKFLPKSLFLEFFSLVFDRNSRNLWRTKLQICRLQKSFLKKKTKIAKFLSFFFFNMKKIFVRNDQEKRDVAKGSNKNFPFFLFSNQQKSLKAIKKEKFLFLHFYLELQFSSFSILKNFLFFSIWKKKCTSYRQLERGELLLRKSSQNFPFFSIQKKECPKDSKKGEKKIKKRKKIFLHAAFSHANFLLLSCQKTRGAANKYFLSLNKRRQYKQKKDFFLFCKKRILCHKIFILFFSSLNTVVSKSSFFRSLPTFSFLSNKNEKRKKELKFESNNSIESGNEKEKVFFFPFEKFNDLKNKGNFTKIFLKNRIFNSLNISKKILQIFLDYFLNLNFLKTQSDSFENLNTFQMIFHQCIKRNLYTFHGKLQKKKKIFFKNCSSFSLFNETFFSLLKKNFSPFYGLDQNHCTPLQKYSFRETYKNFLHFLQQREVFGMYKRILCFYSPVTLLRFEESIFHLFTFLYVRRTLLFSFLNPSFCCLKDKKKDTPFFKGKKEAKNSVLFFPFVSKDASVFKENRRKKRMYTEPKSKGAKGLNQKKRNFVTNVYKQNTFAFCKKFLKNFSINPIFFIFKNYSSNFLFFNNTLLIFLKNKNCTKRIGTLLENFVNFKKHVFSNVHLKNPIQKEKKNFFPFSFPFEKVSLAQHQRITKNFLKFTIFFIRKSKRTSFFYAFSKNKSFHGKDLFQRKFVKKYQKISWILSKKFHFLPTKLGPFSFFRFCPFFSTFLGMNSRNLFPKGQKKFQKFVSQKRILSTLSFEPFSFFLTVQYKKGLQNFFFLSKKPTRKSIKLHLQFCKGIVKNARGQNQFYFMQKLHKKIYSWCQKYKSISTKKIFYYCDSILLKYLWNWARRKHPKKSKIWIRNKYFHFIHSKQWFFGEKRGKNFFCLPLHAQTKIQK